MLEGGRRPSGVNGGAGLEQKKYQGNREKKKGEQSDVRVRTSRPSPPHRFAQSEASWQRRKR